MRITLDWTIQSNNCRSLNYDRIIISLLLFEMYCIIMLDDSKRERECLSSLGINVNNVTGWTDDKSLGETSNRN